MKVLVLGATGYVGGRLVPELLKQGYHVHASSRSLQKLKSRPWAQHDNVSLFEMDVFDPQTLDRAVQGCQVVYYFVHSMVPGQKDFQAADRIAAENMLKVAQQNGVLRIIYLGGLGLDHLELSKHLRSRREVETVLSSGSIPVTILRAAMIIGSGSTSFEILRYLVDRLPVMITPKWVRIRCQPIAIRNVIHYLIQCLQVPQTEGQSFDIGGPDIVTYRQLMTTYQQEAQLPKRWICGVPLLTPRLSAYWIHLVTPISAVIAQPLAEGLRNEVICQENRIEKLIPQELFSCRKAIRLALDRTQDDQVLSHWSDSGSLPPFEWTYEGDPSWAGGTHFEDARSIQICASVKQVWQVVSQIGGVHGWYYADLLWKLRGILDRLVGGVGLRRGRRSQTEIAVGDALDFWRVLQVEELQKLYLIAEMKLPGKATLQFSIQRLGEQRCELSQIARFKPRGLFGIVYWYSLLPFHHYIFNGMLQKIRTLSLAR